MAPTVPETTLIDWFDPSQISHLAAYKQLHNTGQWPEDFVPPHVIFGSYNQLLVMNKIVTYYLMVMDKDIAEYQASK